MNLPLQTLHFNNSISTKLSKQSNQNTDWLMDFPKQIPDNPYSALNKINPKREHQTRMVSEPIASNQLNSFDADEHKLLQKLFPSQSPKISEIICGLPLSEATFKPNLKQYEGQSTIDFKKIIQQKIKKQARNNKLMEKQNLPQTKYQKILENYFKDEKIHKNEDRLLSRSKQKSINQNKKKRSISYRCNQQNTCNKQNIDGNQQQVGIEFQRVREQTSTRRSRSQSILQGWMGLSFQQRQQKMIQNKKIKQQMGLQQKLNHQIQGCTFKPILNQSKNLLNICKSSGKTKENNHHKQYYDRLVRKRLMR